MTNSPIRLILSDIRSTHNVGSIMRTADAAGIELIYACGYTPYPSSTGDPRPAHVAGSNTRAIAKTALGAELSVPVLHIPDTTTAMREAKHDGFKIIVLEQAESALSLYQYHQTGPVAVVVGNEVTGVSTDIQQQADVILEIPMIGTKESLNVSVAAAITMYHLRFGDSL